jgi:hypothetical protein
MSEVLQGRRNSTIAAWSGGQQAPAPAAEGKAFEHAISAMERRSSAIVWVDAPGHWTEVDVDAAPDDSVTDSNPTQRRTTSPGDAVVDSLLADKDLPTPGMLPPVRRVSHQAFGTTNRYPLLGSPTSAPLPPLRAPEQQLAGVPNSLRSRVLGEVDGVAAFDLTESFGVDEDSDEDGEEVTIHSPSHVENGQMTAPNWDAVIFI